MGRVFDGVSSLLGICQESAYEGQCAIELENAAARAGSDTLAEGLPYAIREDESGMLVIDLSASIRSVVELRDQGAPIEAIALRFHVTVCDMVTDTCIRLRASYGLNTVALSGGVFQNRLLLEKTLRSLDQAGFETLVNHAVPPNDGGISLGQAYIARCLQTIREEQKPCV